MTYFVRFSRKAELDLYPRFLLVYEVDSNDAVTVLGVRHHHGDRSP